MAKAQRKYDSVAKRDEMIYQALMQYYEPGVLRHCKSHVYRMHIRKQFGISQRTFFRALQRLKKRKQQEQEIDWRQTTIEFPQD